MKNYLMAFLGVMSVTSASAQFTDSHSTTFVKQKKSSTRNVIEITGQSGEGALRDYLVLAQKRESPQKLKEGQALELNAGVLTKFGSGLRVEFAAPAKEMVLKRKGHRATLTLRHEIAHRLYTLLADAGWSTEESGVASAISPTRSIQCQWPDWSDEANCIIFLEHVLQ